MCSVAEQLGKHRNGVKEVYYKKIIHACAQYFENHLGHYKFTNVQIDETYFGKRKYNAGKPVRASHHWAVTFTQGDVTVWHLVRARDQETLAALIRQHLAPGGSAVVTTDGWRGYKNAKSIPGVAAHHVCVHQRVGKKKTFVNKDGKHINNSESAHASVKRTLKAMFYHYGKGSIQLQANLAIATLFFNKSPDERLRVLLEAVSEWDGRPREFTNFDEIEAETDLEDTSGDEEEEPTSPSRGAEKTTVTTTTNTTTACDDVVDTTTACDDVVELPSPPDGNIAVVVQYPTFHCNLGTK
jgi:IS1 family transposase